MKPKQTRAPPPLDYSFALTPEPARGEGALSLWFVNHTAASVTAHAQMSAYLDLPSGWLPVGKGRFDLAIGVVPPGGGSLADADRSSGSELMLAGSVELVEATGNGARACFIFLDPTAGTEINIPELGRAGWLFPLERRRS